LLDEIKRKAMDSEMLRREAGDMYGQISVLQVAQADIFQQLTQIQIHMTEMRKDLDDSRTRQDQQNQVIKELLMSLTEQGFRGKSLALTVMLTRHGQQLIYFVSTVKNNVNEMLDAISVSQDNPTVYVTAAAENIPQYMNQQGRGQRGSQQMRQPMNINIPSYKMEQQQVTMPISPNASPFSMACSVPAMDSDMFPSSPGGYEEDLRLM
jgi:nitrogen fixation/metabolism regulation signal transduction histidine kinase